MIYSERKFETSELSDGGCDIKFVKELSISVANVALN